MTGQRKRGLTFAFSLLLTLAAAGCSEWGGQRVQLFNGEDLTGWVTMGKEKSAWQAAACVELNPADHTKFKITPGTGILVNGPKGRTNNIHSTYEHGDCRAHIEFVVPEHSNSGIYFQGRYELQVFDSFGKETVTFSDCGGIYARWINNHEAEGKPPLVNASKAPGVWQEYDVIFKAPRFDDSGKKIADAKFVKIWQNGTLIHEDTDLTGPTRAGMRKPAEEVPMGPIILQGDHGPVAYRNIWIKPLKLD